MVYTEHGWIDTERRATIDRYMVIEIISSVGCGGL
jgi:hypothetical protein